MKLVGVTINNYKSFGDSENFLYVNNLNTIIGKNESGKSNLLECLQDIGEIGISNKKLFKKNNRKSNKDINLKLTFETTPDEEFAYGSYQGKVTVGFEAPGIYTINKEFGDYIVNIKEYKETLEKVHILKNEVPIYKSENIEKLLTIIQNFEEANEKIFIQPDYYKEFFIKLKSTNSKKILELLESFTKMEYILQNIYLNFPSFIKIEDIDLKNRYTISELKSELEEESDDSILYQLFKICNIDVENLIIAMESKASTKIRECEENIQELINKNFVQQFNNFYSQEKLTIAIDINSECIDIMIKSTSGAYLLYSERSNGFRWYVSIFIQLLYKIKTSGKNNSYILLLDEPGVYLHANAQKELKNLLSELSKNNQQIIYTTHSPFMVDKDNLISIRALIKDDNGYTHIYNKITTIPTTEKSRYDTITPILHALGCNNSIYDLETSSSKLNIITEGITDYCCLQGYYESINQQMEYNIIPANGANVVSAIASILFGWNCNFVILLDQDEKGRSVYQSLRDTNSPFIDRVIFANASKESNTNIKFEIEDLFSEGDTQKFGINSDDYKEKKYNYITDMYTKIKCKDEKYDDITIQNFSTLLNKIQKYK